MAFRLLFRGHRMYKNVSNDLLRKHPYTGFRRRSIESTCHPERFRTKSFASRGSSADRQPCERKLRVWEKCALPNDGQSRWINDIGFMKSIALCFSCSGDSAIDFNRGTPSLVDCRDGTMEGSGFRNRGCLVLRSQPISLIQSHLGLGGLNSVLGSLSRFDLSDGLLEGQGHHAIKIPVAEFQTVRRSIRRFCSSLCGFSHLIQLTRVGVPYPELDKNCGDADPDQQAFSRSDILRPLLGIVIAIGRISIIGWGWWALIYRRLPQRLTAWINRWLFANVLAAIVFRRECFIRLGASCMIGGT